MPPKRTAQAPTRSSERLRANSVTSQTANNQSKPAPKPASKPPTKPATKPPAKSKPPPRKKKLGPSLAKQTTLDPIFESIEPIEPKGDVFPAIEATVPEADLPAGIETHRDGSPSPTRSIGSDFQLSPDHSIDEVVTWTRSAPKALGFRNAGGVQCYRNSVLVSLFHSKRIMQWIANRYIPALDKTGLMVFPYSGPPGLQLAVENTLEAKSIEKVYYTDVMCELYYLYLRYWADPTQEDLEQAMGEFWEYVQIEARERREVGNWNFQTQQDAPGFFIWLSNLSRCQLAHLHSGDYAPLLPPSERTKLQPLSDLDITEVIRFTKTKRMNCVYCDFGQNVKRRSTALEREVVWPLNVLIPIPADPTYSGYEDEQFRASVTLEECLQRDLKSEMSEAACEACRKKVLEVERVFDTALAAAKQKKNTKQQLQSATEARRARELTLSGMRKSSGYVWSKIAELPETLFISLTRVRPGENFKTRVKVDIPETFDLGAHVEHTIERPAETSYRLVAIVNHQGTLNGGHYVCQTVSDGRWTLFNDQSTSPAALPAIIDDQVSSGSEDDDWTPYLLMYEKIPAGEQIHSQNKAKSIRQVSIPKPTPPSAPQAIVSRLPLVDQSHLDVTARINDTEIRFPTYVVDNLTLTDVWSGEVSLSLSDRNIVNGIEISGKSNFAGASCNKRRLHDTGGALGSKSEPEPKRHRVEFSLSSVEPRSTGSKSQTSNGAHSSDHGAPGHATRARSAPFPKKEVRSPETIPLAHEGRSRSQPVPRRPSPRATSRDSPAPNTGSRSGTPKEGEASSAEESASSHGTRSKSSISQASGSSTDDGSSEEGFGFIGGNQVDPKYFESLSELDRQASLGVLRENDKTR